MYKFTDTQKKQISELKKIYSIKNVKTFRGMEGYGVNATLYKNGKKFTDVIDDGNGGQMFFDDFKNYEILENDVKKIGKFSSDFVVDGKYFTLDYDAETFVNELIDDFTTNKTFKRLCNKNTVFITTDCKEGEYRTVKSLYNSKVKEFITNKYKNDLVEIINERYL